MVRIDLGKKQEEVKREWDWVLVNYKLRSSYAVVWVYILEEDGGVQRYN